MVVPESTRAAASAAADALAEAAVEEAPAASPTHSNSTATHAFPQHYQQHNARAIACFTKGRKDNVMHLRRFALDSGSRWNFDDMSGSP